MRDLDAAEFNTGDLTHQPRTGGGLDTHFWVGEVTQVDVVEVETDRKATLAHTEITGTGSWGNKKIRND